MHGNGTVDLDIHESKIGTKISSDKIGISRNNPSSTPFSPAITVPRLWRFGTTTARTRWPRVSRFDHDWKNIIENIVSYVEPRIYPRTENSAFEHPVSPAEESLARKKETLINKYSSVRFGLLFGSCSSFVSLNPVFFIFIQLFLNFKQDDLRDRFSDLFNRVTIQNLYNFFLFLFI